MRKKGVIEVEQRDSGSDQRGDEDDIPLGPRSNVSLLDQHQHLKEKAEGVCDFSICATLFFAKVVMHDN